MKVLITSVALVLLSLPVFAGGESCGCKTKIVNVHEHEGYMCGHDGAEHSDEVMVGHDHEAGLIYCGTIECSSVCKPESKKGE